MEQGSLAGDRRAQVGIVGSFNVEGTLVMRATNWKRWGILVAGLGVIIGSGALAQRYQVSKLARSVVEQADAAAAKGDFQAAEKLYEQHLMVVQDDVEVQIKYADTLTKYAPSITRQATALGFYGDVLRRFPGRDDVRRKQMELKFAIGRIHDEGAEADLKILLKDPANQTDGNLLFLMGRCYESAKNDKQAHDYYQAAIKYNATKKIDAYQLLATMLRDPARLNDPKAGDEVIEQLVASFPNDYLAYVARGRYRLRFKLAGTKADFERRVTLASDKPEIYLELVKYAESDGREGEAKQILETGLSKLPTAPELYIALADLEQRSGHPDEALDVLDRGLKSVAEKTTIRWLLANSLAMRGAPATPANSGCRSRS